MKVKNKSVWLVRKNIGDKENEFYSVCFSEKEAMAEAEAGDEVYVASEMRKIGKATLVLG